MATNSTLVILRKYIAYKFIWFLEFYNFLFVLPRFPIIFIPLWLHDVYARQTHILKKLHLMFYNICTECKWVC